MPLMARQRLRTPEGRKANRLSLTLRLTEGLLATCIAPEGATDARGRSMHSWRRALSRYQRQRVCVICRRTRMRQRSETRTLFARSWYVVGDPSYRIAHSPNPRRSQRNRLRNYIYTHVCSSLQVLHGRGRKQSLLPAYDLHMVCLCAGMQSESELYIAKQDRD